MISIGRGCSYIWECGRAGDVPGRVALIGEFEGFGRLILSEEVSW